MSFSFTNCGESMREVNKCCDNRNKLENIGRLMRNIDSYFTEGIQLKDLI